MIRRFLRWALGVTREIESLQQLLQHLQQQLKDEKESRIHQDGMNCESLLQIRKFLRMNTTVNVDLAGHPNDHHTIIIVGRYKNRDLIRMFTIPSDKCLSHLLEVLKRMEGYTKPGAFDRPRHMDAIVDQMVLRELGENHPIRIRL